MNSIDVINQAFETGINDDNREKVSNVVSETIASLDSGEIRVAESGPEGNWIVNEWAKKAIFL
jgi:2,3,4,5-tetrahydropyridine-2-carboxylate N-succinyltransferase